jgi:hypothetical protein
MQPDLVKALKKAGLDEDKNAYEIVEEAVTEWLASHRKIPRSSIRSSHSSRRGNQPTE